MLRITHQWSFLLLILLMIIRRTVQQTRNSQECGKNFGCLKWPPNCKLQNCTVLIRFLKKGTASAISVEITGKTNGWIAFGVNEESRKMGGTTGEVCLHEKSKGVTLKSFSNEGTDFKMNDLNARIITQVMGYDNGRLFCSYERPLNANTLADLNKPWYTIVSWGKTKLKGSKIHAREHETGDYFWSESKVDLTKSIVVPLTTFGWNLIAAHGALMVFAWIGFAFSGIFFARHMRVVLQSEVCGTTRWFQFHRISMFCSTILIILAFIIILVEAKGWNTEMEAHPILGIITIILVIVQAVAGILRPSIDSSRRYLFKIFHRLNGAVSYILAVITIFLGLAAMEVDLAVFILYLAVIFIVFVIFEAYTFYKARIVTEVPYQDNELGSSDGTTNSGDTVSFAISQREFLVRKFTGRLVAGLSLCIAIVLVSLIGHKGYVYTKKANV